MRNFGLSGMNSLMMRADERLGMEQRTTNNLQLWKSTKPKEKWVHVFGMTNQARPSKERHSLHHRFCVFTNIVRTQGIAVLMIHDGVKDESGFDLATISSSLLAFMLP